MMLVKNRSSLPAISPSSQLRRKGEAVTGPFHFSFQIHHPSGAVLFLPDSDAGYLEAVRGVRHREPESHIEESAARIADSVGRLDRDIKHMKISGLSDKDLTLLNVLGSVSGQSCSVLFPQSHCLEVESLFTELLSRGGLIDADLIVARHIIEHVRDIDTFITGLRQALKPGALCFIEVPDSTRLFSSGDISQLWEEHTAYFTLATVTNLLEGAGFEVLFEETRVSDGEDLCLLLVRSLGQERPGHRPAIPPGQEEDFLNRLPGFIDRLSSGLSVRSAKRELWLYGANHVSGVFLDLVAHGKAEVRGIIDDDSEKKNLIMSKMDVEIFPNDALRKKKSVDVLVAVAEGRAPALYAKLRQDFSPMDGHNVQSLVSFCEEYWEE